MKQVVETFLLPCPAEAFWEVFMDEGYVRSLYLDGLGFKGFEVLDLQRDSRKLRIVPKLNIPDVLAKLIGDAFAYEEHGVLDRAKNLWTWRMVRPESARTPDLVATEGSVRIEALGETGSQPQCRRRDEITIEGKLFGLARLIESAAEKEARSALGKELPFFARWVATDGQGTSTRIAPPTSTAPTSAR